MTRIRSYFIFFSFKDLFVIVLDLMVILSCKILTLWIDVLDLLLNFIKKILHVAIIYYASCMLMLFGYLTNDLKFESWLNRLRLRLAHYLHDYL